MGWMFGMFFTLVWAEGKLGLEYIEEYCGLQINKRKWAAGTGGEVGLGNVGINLG